MPMPPETVRVPAITTFFSERSAMGRFGPAVRWEKRTVTPCGISIERKL